jgi:transcription antitermination protein NusB
VSARSKARKRALDVMFEADQRGRDPLSTLEDWLGRSDPPVPAYAEELVRGVVTHARRIDDVLRGFTADWPLERLPAVDRAVLRLATYELLWSADVPAAVAIDEAVELAKSLSTDASPGFVNGVLARVLADREQLAESPPV